MTEAEFWASTPYLTGLRIEAVAERERMHYRREMWAAWHVGAFYRVKRMPPLDKAMRGLESKELPKRMSPDEMLRVIEQLNIVHGGRDLRKRNSAGQAVN